MNLGCLLATVFVLRLLQLPFDVAALPSVVKIGAIFTHDQKDSSTELAFKYAVYKINKDRTILPKTTLEYDIQYVPKDDSFHASKKACQQVKYGVQAVFGPSDPILGQHIHSICDALDIPHLEARLDLDTEAKEFSINLYPAQTLLNAAYQDIMEFLNWTKVAIIYEDDYDPAAANERLQVPLSLHDFRYRDLRPRGLQVQFRQYHCLPSGRRRGRGCAWNLKGHGTIPAIR